MSEMIYGIHAVQALLERAPERFQEVFILKGREDKRLLPLIHALESQGVVIQLANRQYLDEKSDGAVHQGIIARVKPGRQYQENDLPDLIASLDQPFLLILDGVTDPHNLGACLRSRGRCWRSRGDCAERSLRTAQRYGEKSSLRRGRKRSTDSGD
ncbi:23S rRNA (guanosine-2'-O-)-methyltransferase rlmB [Escherichia coli]|uniref:23S rRNA (Guanosine-2'-O-)-methyltransferase rlmB n=1 Tax=Escherichia coli TaxID=562 RepID=A0A2X3K757_ECOLX|nr:23S rRNA (guanosine-2'-O-)-methyltransferase rlmB [Escherichia coli]